MSFDGIMATIFVLGTIYLIVALIVFVVSLFAILAEIYFDDEEKMAWGNRMRLALFWPVLVRSGIIHAFQKTQS